LIGRFRAGRYSPVYIKLRQLFIIGVSLSY
jgi:hypothetical protein